MSDDLKKTVRKDGLRIVSKHLPHTKRFRISIGAKSGSAYDPPDKDGLNHLFEHMGFRGTTSLSGEELRADLNRYCHYKNAYTDRLETVYQFESVSRHAAKICDLAMDIYQNPAFLEDVLEKEKEVVCNEIARDNDNDPSRNFFNLCELLWCKNPLRKFGVGTPAGIAAVSRTDLVKVHQRFYIPSNTFIVATGDVDHAHVVEKARHWLPESLEKITHPVWDDEHHLPPTRNEITVRKPKIEKACVVFGQKIPNRNSLTERESLVLSVLVELLDAMLTREIRDKLGYVYTVDANVYGDFELGHYLLASAEMLPNRVVAVKKLILSTLCEAPLEQKSFTETCEGLRDKLIVALEFPVQWDKAIIDHGIKRNKELGYLAGLAQRRDSILGKLKFDEVLEMRERLIDPARFACAIIRPK